MITQINERISAISALLLSVNHDTHKLLDEYV